MRFLCEWVYLLIATVLYGRDPKRVRLRTRLRRLKGRIENRTGFYWGYDRSRKPRACALIIRFGGLDGAVPVEIGVLGHTFYAGRFPK